jgi:hypothetical protein
MSEEHAVGTCFGVFAVALGAALSYVLVRHRRAKQAARARDEYVPFVDPRGIWLWLNGPVTLLAGLAILGNGAVAAWDQHRAEEERRALASIELGCAPGSLAIASTEARSVDVAGHAFGRDGAAHALRLEPRSLDLEPGVPQEIAVRTLVEGACDRDGPWDDCASVSVTVIMRDGTTELARGSYACDLPRRAEPRSIFDVATWPFD